MYKLQELQQLSVQLLVYGLNDGLNSWQEQEMYLLATSTRPALGPTQPPKNNGDTSMGVKHKGCETEYSPPSSAEVKKKCS
jgi:hypothetical protein